MFTVHHTQSEMKGKFWIKFLGRTWDVLHHILKHSRFSCPYRTNRALTYEEPNQRKIAVNLIHLHRTHYFCRVLGDLPERASLRVTFT